MAGTRWNSEMNTKRDAESVALSDWREILAMDSADEKEEKEKERNWQVASCACTL